MIKDTIQNQIVEAMKAKEEVRVSTLKLLSSAIHNAKIAKRPAELSEEDELTVVKREAKKRKDAIELYEKGGVMEKADRERQELKILEMFLPEEMGEIELIKIVEDVIKEIGAKEMGDVGRTMGGVMERVKGQVDGNRVSQIVQEKLSK